MASAGVRNARKLRRICEYLQRLASSDLARIADQEKVESLLMAESASDSCGQKQMVATSSGVELVELHP